jgi:hypothetical protein
MPDHDPAEVHATLTEALAIAEAQGATGFAKAAAMAMRVIPIVMGNEPPQARPRGAAPWNPAKA